MGSIKAIYVSSGSEETKKLEKIVGVLDGMIATKHGTVNAVVEMRAAGSAVCIEMKKTAVGNLYFTNVDNRPRLYDITFEEGDVKIIIYLEGVLEDVQRVQMVFKG